MTWNDTHTDSFNLLKGKLSSTPVLALPNFSITFEIAVDASSVGRGAVLSQNHHAIEYYSEKLSSPRKKWSTYEQELYYLIWDLKQWEHYLFGKEFILYTDHYSLKFHQTQKTVNRMHACWLTFIQRFDFLIKHTEGHTNKVADALSRKDTLLTLLKDEIIAFDTLPQQYFNDHGFHTIWQQCLDHVNSGDFYLADGFLLKNNRSCIPHTSLREQLIKEAHSCGLAGHFGKD